MDLIMVLIMGFITIITVGYYLIKRQYQYWKNHDVLYDEPNFLYGNMKGVNKDIFFHEFIRNFYVKYKNKASFVGIYLFVRKGIIPLDLDLIKNILIKDFSNFTDRGLFHNEKDDPLSGHLFLLDGQKWSVMRKKLSPTFTSGKMKFMFPTVVEVGNRFNEVLHTLVPHEGTNIEMKDLLARFTTDVIGTCAFGIECNSLKDPNAEFRRMGKRIFAEPRHGRFGRAFLMNFPDLARSLHMKQAPDFITEFFMKVVSETVAFRENSNIKRNDFLDILIEMKKSGLEGGITIEEITAQVFVFFLAGFETSSSTLGYCFYELAKNPDIQEKLRKEIVDVLKKHDGKFTYECMKDMRYMEQVIMETLRKYPIVTVLMRKAINDYTDSISGKNIPKDTRVLIPTHAIHYDESIYPKPEVFDPERFAFDQRETRHSMSWLPFGDGPRNCIGLRFGKMQIRVALATLLQNFKFSVSEMTQEELTFDIKLPILLSAVGGITLRVEKNN